MHHKHYGELNKLPLTRCLRCFALLAHTLRVHESGRGEIRSPPQPLLGNWAFIGDLMEEFIGCGKEIHHKTTGIFIWIMLMC